MLKKIIPVCRSRMRRSTFVPDCDCVFSRTSRYHDERKGSGILAALCGIRAIEPGSGPRRMPLLTRMEKKESGWRANSNEARFGFSAEPPLGESRSRLMARVAFPRRMTRFSTVTLFGDRWYTDSAEP